MPLVRHIVEREEACEAGPLNLQAGGRWRFPIGVPDGGWRGGVWQMTVNEQW